MLHGPELAPLSGNEAKQLVVFLHGVGSDGDDLISLADNMRHNFPDAHFIAPNAPFPYDGAPFGYQWFSLKDRTESFLLNGINEALPILNQFLDDSLKRLNLDDSNLILIGFSQGTMIGLHAALRRPKKIAALVGFSGALLSYTYLSQQTLSKPNIMLIHGDLDEVVPHAALAYAIKALGHLSITAKQHTCRGIGHGISPEGIQIATDFILQNINA
jgi:phospholipase/carboxylesterase